MVISGLSYTVRVRGVSQSAERYKYRTKWPPPPSLSCLAWPPQPWHHRCHPCSLPQSRTVRAASTQLARHPSHPTTPRQSSSLQLVRQLARHPSHPTSPRQPSSLHQTLVYCALRQQDSVSPSRVGCRDGVVRMQTFAWDWHRGVNHSELMGRRESWVEAGTPNDGKLMQSVRSCSK